MKEIKAVIQNCMVDDVCHALGQIPELPGLTLTQVTGFGRTRAVDDAGTAKATGRALAKMTKVEIVVSDELAPMVVDLISRAARTGKPGDGKIFLFDVLDAVKIRNGVHGDAAL